MRDKYTKLSTQLRHQSWWSLEVVWVPLLRWRSFWKGIQSTLPIDLRWKTWQLWDLEFSHVMHMLSMGFRSGNLLTLTAAPGPQNDCLFFLSWTSRHSTVFCAVRCRFSWSCFRAFQDTLDGTNWDKWQIWMLTINIYRFGLPKQEPWFWWKDAAQLMGMTLICHVLRISFPAPDHGNFHVQDGLLAAVSNRWRHHCWAMPSLLHFGLLRCNWISCTSCQSFFRHEWYCSFWYMIPGHSVPRLFPKRYGGSCFDLQILQFWSVLMLRSAPSASFLPRWGVHVSLGQLCLRLQDQRSYLHPAACSGKAIGTTIDWIVIESFSTFKCLQHTWSFILTLFLCIYVILC